MHMFRNDYYFNLRSQPREILVEIFVPMQVQPIWRIIDLSSLILTNSIIFKL